MYDFIMIGWELNYSRNRVLLHDKEYKVKTVEINQENLIIRDLKTFFKFLYILLTCKTNVVYIPAFNQVNAPIILILSKLFRKKIIIDLLVSEYDTVVEDRKLAEKGSLKAKRAYLLDKICVKYGDILICDTQLHKEYFIENFDAESSKIHVIPVGADQQFYVNSSRIHDVSSLSNKKFSVLFYGGYSPLHGIDIIIKSANLLKEHQDIHFTLVGKGQTKDEMVKLAENLELENITFIDNIPYDELPVFIDKFDIGLGIFGETGKTDRVVPNKVYQLAANKKAIITKFTPGIREIFTEGKDIVLISNEAMMEEKLANAIVELKNNPLKQDKLAHNAYELMCKDCSYEKIGRTFEKLIKKFR